MLVSLARAMNSLRLVLLGFVSLLIFAGCKPPGKNITDLQRKEAAHAESEARFAFTMRQWDRAEGLYVQATKLCPDTGAYWLGLGAARIQLGRRDGAKDAYKSALKAFEDEAAARKDEVEPWLKQAHVLALLGRVPEGRAVLEKAAKKFPNDRTVRTYLESKAYDRMVADPTFKQNAL